jgi:MFS family permease
VNAAFRRALGASAASNLGDGVRGAALPLVAASLTRDPLAFSAVAVAGSLPWLLLSLPAGAVLDRVDRVRAMAVAAAWRAAAVGLLGAAVATGRAGVPLLVAVALLLGAGEVLFDNAAQTLVPALVPRADLERANGRLYAVEITANSFAGPPLGGALFVAAAAVPLLVDAGLLAVAALLLVGLGGHVRRAAPDRSDGLGAAAAVAATSAPREPLRVAIATGVRWLRGHRLLRTLAVLLAVMNGTASMGMATFGLFVLGEGSVLGLGPVAFSVLLTSGAVGSLLGSLVAARVVRRAGRLRVLWSTLIASAGTSLAVGLSRGPVEVGLALAAMGLTGVAWNVVTVSLRQTIIPDELLGRVNSVYRFLGWGSIPVGGALGGVVADVAGLRAPWVAAAAVSALALIPAARVLRGDVLDAALAGGSAGAV